jgi:hypothetical protein
MVRARPRVRSRDLIFANLAFQARQDRCVVAEAIQDTSNLHVQTCTLEEPTTRIERGCSMRNLMGFHAHVGEFPKVLIESCHRDVFSRSGSRN